MVTQDAYDAACAALWKHRARADKAESLLWKIASADVITHSKDGSIIVIAIPVNLLSDIQDTIGYDEMGQ